MENRLLRFKLAFTIVWVNVFYLLLTFSLEYLNKSIFYNFSSLLNYFSFMLFVFTTKVIPLVGIYFVILFLFFKPLQKAIDQLSEGLEITRELRNKANKIILNMPKLLVAANTSGYVIGVVLRMYSEFGYPSIHTYRGWMQLFYGFVLGGTLALIQISINNIILLKPLRMFKLHYLEDKKVIERVFKLKIFWVVLFLAFYIALYVYDNSTVSFDHENYYSSLIESVVLKEKTLDSVREEYKSYIAERLKTDKNNITFPMDIKSKDNRKIEHQFYFTAVILFIFIISFGAIFFSVRDFLIRILNVKIKMKDILRGEGDLTKRINIIHNDTVGRLSDNINRFLERLRVLLTQVKKSTESVAEQKTIIERTLEDFVSLTESNVKFVGSVNDITTNQVHVLDSTKEKLKAMLENFKAVFINVENLSSFVQKTDLSMHQMGDSIQSITTIVKKVNNLSTTLVNITDMSKDKVESAISAINNIHEASKNVEDIVSVITEISERTNLLAMNASIEAAHAGSYGKGFTVVADEIRKLAEDSSTQTNRISEIIKNMTALISNGVALSLETGNSLHSIYSSIIDTTELLGDISKALDEQNCAITDILNTIASVSTATQETKLLTDGQKKKSEDITASMHELIQVSNVIYKKAKEQDELNKNMEKIVEKVKNVIKKNTVEFSALENELIKFKV